MNLDHLQIDKLGNRIRFLSILERMAMDFGTILFLMALKFEYVQVAGVLGFGVMCGNRWIAQKREGVLAELEFKARQGVEPSYSRMPAGTHEPEHPQSPHEPEHPQSPPSFQIVLDRSAFAAPITNQYLCTDIQDGCE